MNSKFENIVEEQMSSITKTKTMRFPRQINFSEEFMEAIEKEYYTQVLAETPEAPVRNRPQKFIKALEFVVADLVKNEAKRKCRYRTMNEGTEEYEASSEHTPEQRTGDDDKKEEKVKEEVLDKNMGVEKD